MDKSGVSVQRAGIIIIGNLRLCGDPEALPGNMLTPLYWENLSAVIARERFQKLSIRDNRALFQFDSKEKQYACFLWYRGQLLLAANSAILITKFNGILLHKTTDSRIQLNLLTPVWFIFILKRVNQHEWQGRVQLTHPEMWSVKMAYIQVINKTDVRHQCKNWITAQNLCVFDYQIRYNVAFIFFSSK